MNFEGIPTGASVFFDANIFVYSFADDPSCGEACTTLLERVERGELEGYSSAALLSDVAHRLMTLEACESLSWPFQGIALRLRRHPEQIQNLTRFRQALDEIVNVGVRILPTEERHVLLAGDISRRHGLLSGDALIVATMQLHGIQLLATNDADFDKVPGITRFSPL